MKHTFISVIFIAFFLSLIFVGCGEGDSKQSYLAGSAAESAQEQEASASCTEGNHSWGETSYTWSKDGSTCTAVRSCTASGCDAEERETATVNNESKAEFENNAFVPQDQSSASENNDTNSSPIDTPSDTVDQKNENSKEEDGSSVENIGNSPAFVVSDAKGKAGDRVSVTISVVNNPGIIAAALDVTYDQSKIKLVDAKDAGLLAKPTFAKTTQQFPYYVSWNDALATKNNDENGVMVTLTFEILNGAQGTAEVLVSYEAGNVFDSDLNDVVFKTISGFVEIK